MNFRTVFVGALLVIVVVAGALVWRSWDAISGFVDQVGAKQEICSTLDDDERMELVGVETPTMLLDVEGSLDRYTCRWATEDHETVPTFVQAVSAPADTWAVELKRSIASGSAQQYPRRARRMLEAAAKRVKTPADGCRLARALFKMSGAAAGARRAVVPSAMGDTPMMVAQSCVDGTYSAVMVTAPGLELDRGLARKTAQALRKVEKRLD